MGAWLKWLLGLAGGGPEGSKRSQSLRWLLIVGLIGVGLMLVNSFQVKTVEPAAQGPASGGPDAKPVMKGLSSRDKSPYKEVEDAYQSQLKEILQKIVGVGDVEVLVNVDGTEETVVDRNTKDTQQLTIEKDLNGATRNITDVNKSGEVVLYQVSGNQQPLVVKTIKPKIRGVLVVAKGAENLTVKKMISEAVERGLEVPPHKISILPRKQ